jgi:glycosyltransferase involved in cell wall biosynthesis
MLANITVVTHNRCELTIRTIDSLLARTRGEFVVNVVDNGSRDGTREYLRGLAGAANVRVHLLGRNMGVAVAANLGWAAVRAPYYVKLDNDVEILDGTWLERLLGTMRRNPGIGMAGYRLCNWTHHRETVVLPDGERFIASGTCNGGCAAIPETVHERLGFWVEDYGKYGFEDQDYSDRVVGLGLLAGYVGEADGILNHIGFEPESMDPSRETVKKQSTESLIHGRQMYVLNRFLFENGLRPLYAQRRYLAVVSGDTVRFASNPAYVPITKIQREYVGKIRYEPLEKGIRIRFSSQE